MRGRMSGMRFRKLRIAWSVFWGVTGVLLIALWVRSYCRTDYVYACMPPAACWFDGSIGILRLRGAIDSDRPFGCSHYSTEAYKFVDINREITDVHFPRIVEGSIERFYILVPYWFALLSVAGLSMLPWIRWRFSLRTLLVATTLVAVVLGLVVWAIRQ
jgi:hypothetical protein